MPECGVAPAVQACTPSLGHKIPGPTIQISKANALTIAERDLRSRGQTFHSVPGALTALWPVSDKIITD